MKNQIKAYMSHSIRGKMGVNATNEYMIENNKKAIKFGKALAEAIPGLDVYIPGEHDEFVCIAYRQGYLTEEQILDVDCKIIDTCHFMIIYSEDGYISRGMQVEVDHCVKTRTPIVSVVNGTHTTDEYFKKMVEAVNCQLLSYMR